MKKILALVLAGVMAFALVACGESGETAAEGGEAEAPASVGETQAWGKFEVAVPDGMTLEPGSMFDETDETALTVEKTGDALTYIMLSYYDDASSADDSIEMSREMNSDCDIQDLTLSLANGEWTGICYNSYGTDCLIVKANIGSGCVTATAAGFATDDATLQGVIASITVK